MAYVIEVTGVCNPVKPAGKKFTLAELQAAIGGGYIEAVPGTNGRVYCDEEGRLKDLPFNVSASVKYGRRLVGKVMVLEQGDHQ